MSERITRPRRFRAHPGWHAVGVGLVVGWLVVLGCQLEWWGARAAWLEWEPGSGEVALRDEDYWMGAYRAGRKVGSLHARVQHTPQGIQLEQELTVQLAVGDQLQPLRSQVRAELTDGARLRSLTTELVGGPVGFSARARVEAAELVLEVDWAGQRLDRRLPLAEPPLFDQALPALLARRGPAPGERFRVLAFDPQALANRPVEIEVVGHEALQAGGRLRPVVHLRRALGDWAVDSWLGADGVLWKEQLPGGLVLLREEAEEAQRGVTGLTIDGLAPTATGWLQGLLPGMDGSDHPAKRGEEARR